MSRREFARRSLAAIGTVAGTAAIPGCSGTSSPGEEGGARTAVTGGDLPLFEVSGSPREIGRGIGNRCAGRIRGVFEDLGEDWRDLVSFADSQPDGLLDSFVEAAKAHAPSAFEELRGMAEGSGVPLRDLLVYNLKAEYAALRLETEGNGAGETPGCSSIAVVDDGRCLLAHNEDGDRACRDRMFLLRIRPTGGPVVLGAAYPGILPGNAPWVNDRGIVMTTNFIATLEVRPGGVGRYFLDRLAMEARTLDEAIAIGRHPERAYAFHYFVGSAPDRRIVSLEVTPGRHVERDVSGLFLHTNHLTSTALRDEPQVDAYVESSSMARWRTLCAWREAVPDEAAIDADRMLEILSSHEGRPYSPCRHPEGAVRGATLLTAIFDLDSRSLRIVEGPPCRGASRWFEW
jgi:isopenicillin-N N-acyltransferase-like protein